MSQFHVGKTLLIIPSSFSFTVSPLLFTYSTTQLSGRELLKTNWKT